MNILFVPLLLVSSFDPPAFHFHRAYSITAGVPLPAPRLVLAAGELTRDGITDFVALPRSTGFEYAPRFCEAGYHRRNPHILSASATDVAVVPGFDGAATDAMFTVTGEELHRWAWNEGTQSLFSVGFTSAAWAGSDLVALAAANGLMSTRYVTVATEGDPSWIHVLADDGSGFTAAAPPFAVPGPVLDVQQLDFDVRGDGDPAHVAVQTATGVTVYDLDGTVDGAFAGNVVHWAVLRTALGESDGLVLAEVDVPGDSSTLTMLHPVHGTNATVFSGWRVTGLDTGDATGDGIPDVAFGRTLQTRYGLLTNMDWAGLVLDATNEFGSPSWTGVAVPNLHDHDNDGDLDLLAVVDGVLHVQLGGVDEDAFALDVTGYLKLDGVTYGLQIGAPTAPVGEPWVAWRLSHQSPFDPETAAEFEASETIEVAPGGWPVQTNVVLSGLGAEDVYYLETFIIDKATSPWRAYPVTDYGWPRHPSQGETQLDELCLHFGSGFDCTPKENIGIIEIPFIPPPAGPSM